MNNFVLTILKEINDKEEKLSERQNVYRFWYRGENRDYKKNALRPGIYRDVNSKSDFNSSIKREDILIKDFYSYCHSVLDKTPINGWDWLSKCQHHGLSTRLLDWTENKLQAVFFAFENWDVKKDEFPRIYILNPNELNRISIHDDSIMLAEGEDLKAWLPNTLRFFESRVDFIKKRKTNSRFKNCPISIYSKHSDSRISRQSSTFLLFGDCYHSLNDFLKKKNQLKFVLNHVDIKDIFLSNKTISNLKPELFKDQVLDELDKLNINKFTTYGDLDSLSVYLNKAHPLEDFI